MTELLGGVDAGQDPPSLPKSSKLWPGCADRDAANQGGIAEPEHGDFAGAVQRHEGVVTEGDGHTADTAQVVELRHK